MKRRLGPVFAALALAAGGVAGAAPGTGIIAIWAGAGIGDGSAATSAILRYALGAAFASDGSVLVADTWNHHRVRRISGGIVSSVAGLSVPGYSGDGGPSQNALLSAPINVATDGAGAAYVADMNNNRIRRISPSGTITTVAGTGTAIFSGDGGPATSAGLYLPQSVAVDAAGNLYIADTFNVRIRKVTASGIISTIAGSGLPKISSGDGGPAIAAKFVEPSGVAVDSAGNVYVADDDAHRVRRIAPSGIITTVAGTGLPGFGGDGGPATTALLQNPRQVAVDAAGNLYIADQGNRRVRKVSPSGTITTVAGGGGCVCDNVAATQASIAAVEDVDVDASGALVIAAWDVVRRVSPSGTITTIAGGGPRFAGDGGQARNAIMDGPVGVTADRVTGNVYIADTDNHRVRRVSPAGIITTIAGDGIAGFGGDGGPASSARLNGPRRVAVDAIGNVYIADTGNHRVRRIGPGGAIGTVAGNGNAGFGGDGGQATVARLSSPSGVGIDSAGILYIADTGNNRIRRVDPRLGIITTVAGTGVPCPSEAAILCGDAGLAILATLSAPEAVAPGPDGTLFIADTGASRIRAVNALGVITTYAGRRDPCLLPAQACPGAIAATALLYPRDVAVDASGNVFIADSEHSRVMKVFPDGTATRVAGAPGSAWPDGVPATTAEVYVPSGISIGANGDVYIAQSRIYHRVLRIGGPS